MKIEFLPLFSHKKGSIFGEKMTNTAITMVFSQFHRNFGGLGSHNAQFFDLNDDIMDGDGFGFLGPRPESSGHSPFRSQTFTPGSQSRKNALKQDPPIEHELYVSLEEILKGCTKRMKITKKVQNSDGETFRKEDKVLTINIRPGWKAGTRVTFQKEGDQSPNRIPADIVFIIKDKPDSRFKREGVDVKHTARITLREVRNHFLMIIIPKKFPTRKNESVPSPK